MDANRQDAFECIKRAKSYAAKGDRENFDKFILKAKRLDPSLNLSKVKFLNEDHRPQRSRSVSLSREKIPSKPREKSIERNFTKAQVESVRHILSCKDLYGVLGLTKDASEDDIKKAYKTLARKLHPDKNQAPGATEAFKKIGSASAVLLDPTKRRRYDQFGTVGDAPQSVTRQRHSDGVYYQFDGHHGFDAEMFNMFFNTGFPFSQNPRPQARTRANRENERENNYFAYIQILPLLILFGLSFFSNLFVKDPYFSLSRTTKYPVERITTVHKLPYYVKQSFMSDYDGTLGHLETQVIEQHVYYLRDRCFKERGHKESLVYRARYTSDPDLYERARAYKTPSCDRVAQIYG